jgi:excisionase family DNA binding protein
MRSRIVSIFSDALANAQVPVFDVATRYTELGDALMPLINPVISAKYGIEVASFIVENVSVPPEVEEAIDKRSAMSAIGNLNDYVKYQMAQGMAEGGGGGAAGMASELAVGFAVAKELMQQGGLTGGTPPPLPGAAPAAAAAAVPPNPDILDPATVARMLGVSEADVMAEIEGGTLPAKKIGSSYRVTRAALDTFLAH